MASLIEVGLRDMRVPGVTDYFPSYAYNDDALWGRRPQSAQRLRSNLAMGRYAGPGEAWTSANPDLSTINYITGANRTQAWTRITQWDHIYLGETHRYNHLPGYQQNSRVMIFDRQLWTRSASTGQWANRVPVADRHTTRGQWESPDYTAASQNYDWRGDQYRIESSTGYASIRVLQGSTGVTSGADAGVDYWMWHGYTPGYAMDGNDVDDVVSIVKVSLVLHDAAGTDDRHLSRYLYCVGADYVGDAPPPFPGVGTSRFRFVTARWPQWEYRVLHTMTQAQWETPGRLPAEFYTLTEDSGTGSGGGTTTPPPAASRGNWFAKTSGGQNAWNAAAVTNTAPTTVRRPRRRKLFD